MIHMLERITNILIFYKQQRDAFLPNRQRVINSPGAQRISFLFGKYLSNRL